MIDEETLAQLRDVGEEVEFPAGQVIIEHNTPATGLYVILEGRVAVHAHGADLERGPGEVVGELALARGGPRRARVTAVTPVKALSVSREHVDPELAKRLAG